MFNFNGDQDFSISFWINPKGVPIQEQGINNSTIENGFIIENYQPKEIVNSKKRYILCKSRRKTSPTLNYDSTGVEVPAENRFPYEIYMISSSLYFDMADENETKSITTKIEGLYNNSFQPVHIFCQNSGSIMELWKNGTKVSTTTTSFKDQTRNTANLYIATSGADTIIDQSGGIESSSIEGGFIIGNYVDNPHNTHRRFNGSLNNIRGLFNSEKFLFIPIIIDENINDLTIYSGNPIYDNWISFKKKHHLINYILPTEDLEDLTIIKKKYNEIENYNFEEIINKYYLDNCIITLIFVNKQDVRILSKIITKNNIVIKNNTFTEFNLNNEDKVKLLIDKLRNIYEDIWKENNQINTSIKLPLIIRVDNKKSNDLIKFENILNELDLVNYFSIKKFNQNQIFYEIVFRSYGFISLNISERISSKWPLIFSSVKKPFG